MRGTEKGIGYKRHRTKQCSNGRISSLHSAYACLAQSNLDVRPTVFSLALAFDVGR